MEFYCTVLYKQTVLMKIGLHFLITAQLIILWVLSKGQNINSGDSSAVGTGFHNSNVNTVRSSERDNELSAIENNIHCTVRNGRIYVNGRYARNMQPRDYLSLYQYKESVARWSMILIDNIQLSFPWDLRNPEHKEFPWNPAAFPGKRRRRAAVPFPRLPQFCYE
ncbi:Uncharacterized protein BM_BM9956 [Brugia malayi]|uniref:Bm9956, isoform b n=1 Tax=Brugia malayi TaxID=6279 RepID=A0A1P6CH61_BRUMA|nr:Uncharacterized protein BM_BM9956 [Brugia malayi]CDP96195.1 Bm9956, isoform b [Brugia malayi]VIO98526.1 Uncharacterized protein BM_BM9956 [Brugia malayi]